MTPALLAGAVWAGPFGENVTTGNPDRVSVPRVCILSASGPSDSDHVPTPPS
jgi:hypothetical protein